MCAQQLQLRAVPCEEEPLSVTVNAHLSHKKGLDIACKVKLRIMDIKQCTTEAGVEGQLYIWVRDMAKSTQTSTLKLIYSIKDCSRDALRTIRTVLLAVR